MNQAKLIFEDGTVFTGKVFAGNGERFGEVVFNTGMTGYQEVLTDPSYTGQFVVMTYPLIGNYGINKEDVESKKIFLEAFLVKEYIDFPSNWRSEKTLKTYLEENNILGVEGLDTRALTKFIREKGAQKAIITNSSDPIEVVLQKLKTQPSMTGQNLVKKVSVTESFNWNNENKKIPIAVIDCGIKFNILRLLAQQGFNCTVFPYNTKPEEILTKKYQGLFLSNGPGDPEPVKEVISLVQNCLGKIPIFGICLGHQILGIALGAKTYKLKFGHHGLNHPVKNLKTGHIEITSQNHGFSIDPETINLSEIAITHVNLNDQTIEGIKSKKYPAFSVQYHPEAAPGPHDSAYLFQEFKNLF